MWRDLTVASDASGAILFDPVAAREAGNAHDESDLSRETSLGLLFEYDPASDGVYAFRVAIDEPWVPSESERFDKRVDGSILRVPSGRLWCVSREQFASWRGGEGEPSSDDDEPLDVPPGTYRLDVVERDDDEAWDAVEARLGSPFDPSPPRTPWLEYASCLSGTLGAVAVLAALVTLLVTGDWLTCGAVGALGLGLFAIGIRLVPTDDRTNAAERERGRDVQRQFGAELTKLTGDAPAIRIILTRVDDSAVPSRFPPARLCERDR